MQNWIAIGVQRQLDLSLLRLRQVATYTFSAAAAAARAAAAEATAVSANLPPELSNIITEYFWGSQIVERLRILEQNAAGTVPRAVQEEMDRLVRCRSWG